MWTGSDVGTELTIWMISCFAAARVRQSSPSGCPSLPSAVAVIYTGMLVLNPQIEVEKSTCLTSRRIRGRNHTLHGSESMLSMPKGGKQTDGRRCGSPATSSQS
jgi:hypothetical protein